MRKMAKTEINKFGNIIERNFILSGDRYSYDFQKCKAEDGWKQFDTNQDAWYFGIWCNQKKLQIMCYVEGDEILTKCKDAESYNKELKEMEEFYGSPPPAFIVIDTNRKTKTEIFDKRPKPIIIKPRGINKELGITYGAEGST